ncbi:MAG: PfkB family carbohydrate kinase [Phototrophicaceae bacterium]
MTDNLKALVPQLANHHVLVLGDVILDEYVIGSAHRMSREAPIPVLELETRRFIPGGAANPAVNIVGLGSAAVQVGIIGSDDAATHLREQLDAIGIDVTGLVIDTSKPTTLKTRILAQMGLRFPQQIARIDTISRDPIGQFIQAALMQRLQTHIDSTDAILISDYQNGLLTSNVITLVKQINRGNKPVIVDTQGALDKYHGVDVIKCNADDAAQFLNTSLETNEDFAGAARELALQLSVKTAVVITRGSDGATLATQDAAAYVNAPDVSDVYDTVGAGDTWIAVMTLAMIAGADLADAALLANVASGIVVRHVGNYTPSPAELLAALSE